MAARNNTIILGCITRSRVSRKKGGESPTLFYVGQIPWVHGLALGALQEARAKQDNSTEDLLCGRTIQSALHIFSHFISGKLRKTSITPVSRRRNWPSEGK